MVKFKEPQVCINLFLTQMNSEIGVSKICTLNVGVREVCTAEVLVFEGTSLVISAL